MLTTWLRGVRCWCWLRWQLLRSWLALQLQRALLWAARRSVDWTSARMMRAAAYDDTGSDFEFWLQQHRGWKERLQRSRLNLGRHREHLKAVRLWVHCLRAVPLRALPQMVARSLQSLGTERPRYPRAVPASELPN